MNYELHKWMSNLPVWVQGDVVEMSKYHMGSVYLVACLQSIGNIIEGIYFIVVLGAYV